MSEIIDMLLWCPCCGARHIDTGVFVTKEHHTHACQSCGMVWRPALIPTRGVQFLPGFKDAIMTDTPDIVERLRLPAHETPFGALHEATVVNDMCEAATIIEALRRDKAELVEALEEIARSKGGSYGSQARYYEKIARDALKEAVKALREGK